jgi:hypothetical protein
MVKKDQYTVETIDVDGDGIPDGELVIHYINGKIKSKKFVPLKKLKKIANDVEKISKAENKKNNKTPKTPPKTPKMIYKTIPEVQETDKPVLIQDETKFAQYIKAGAGNQIGRLATDAVADALAGLFEDDE